MAKILVLGSINIDLMITTPRMPNIGETILGNDVSYMFGGKGANQAVAASRVGGEVTFLGGVGEDSFGKDAISNLERENIDTKAVKIFKKTLTGMATVFKFPIDNSIIVLPGANNLIGREQINDYFANGIEEKVFLTQLEIPMDIVKEALQLAKKKKMITILNPAPYREEVKEMIEFIDFITPNETEFESLYGSKLESGEALERAMLEWSGSCSSRLIVTRGSQGVSYVEKGEIITIPAMKVEVKDTTGAGDTLNGIFAHEISNGAPVHKAIQRANVGASLAIQKFGAQDGMPTNEEIDGELHKVK